MTSIRSFIAIELSDHARSELKRLQDRLRDIAPPKTVRWTTPKNIHLTLHFLGDLPLDHAEKVSHTLRDVAVAHAPFTLNLSNLGCFPSTRRPRIVWVGLSGETEALVNLHRELGERLKQGIGFQPESRPYSPHLTIGRVNKGVSQRGLSALGQLLENEIPRVGELAVLPVQGIHFIRSDLKPDGPVYTSLAHGNLSGTP
jgi:2'-5' RNA ligase